MLSPKEFFARFVERFNTQAENPDSEIGLYYRSYGEGQELGDAWTHAMGVFLMRLAKDFGYFQFSKRIDFKWNESPKPRGVPIVSIEHENDSSKIKEEIEALLGVRGKGSGTRARLKVLITYLKHRKREKGKSEEDTLSELKDSAMNLALGNPDYRKASGDFILIIGNPQKTTVRWYGFLLDWTSRDWEGLT